MNLDDPIYENRFARSVRDSRGIIVGAGIGDDDSGNPVTSPTSWTNFGSRVDVQGWGGRVATLGYGNSGSWSRVNGDDVKQFYTGGFSGTSSASPIVAGAVAAIQGIRKTRGLPVLDPFQMQRTLRETGTEQPHPLTKQIGPLPNLRAALNSLNLYPEPTPGWPSLGGILVSAPTLSRNADGRLEIFALGTDDCLWHIWQTAPSNGWSGWVRQGDARLKGRIHVTHSNDRRLEIFVRGQDNTIWHIWQTAPSNGWSGWENMGGNKTSDPTAIINRDGRMEVFARGTDNALYRKIQSWVNGPWWPLFSGWDSLGGVILGAPAVARNADGRLEVFARGTDGAIWHRWQISPSGGWSDWNSLGGVLTTEPVVAQNVDGRLQLFARGLDGSLWHIWQTACRATVGRVGKLSVEFFLPMRYRP